MEETYQNRDGRVRRKVCREEGGRVKSKDKEIGSGGHRRKGRVGRGGGGSIEARNARD